MTAKDAISKLDRYIRSRYPIVAIVSHEEGRVMAAIRDLANTRGRLVGEWTITQGLQGLETIDPTMSTDPAAALMMALDYIKSNDTKQPTLFVLKDFHAMLNNAVTVRALRDVASACEESKHTVILLCPALEVPGDLEKTVTVIDWPLPDLDELAAILARTEKSLPSKVPVTLNGSRELVVKAMQGLTAVEAENALLAAVVATGELGEGVLEYIVKEKAQIIRKSGSLEFYDAKVSMAQVGGLKALKAYAGRKLKTFGDKAKEFGLPSAKGVLLVGVPGTGKSLTAKAIASGKMPLLKLDMSAVPSGTVGGGEGNIRQALKIADAVSPCVLWLDEIEKGLADNGGASDGGMMQRVRGALLTWMQEHTTQVFVVATANNIQQLPPELIRRFDDTFFVDLPNAASRAEILAVQLAKYHRTADCLGGRDAEIITALWGFTGAEIEKAVVTALEIAFDSDADLSAEILIDAISQVNPISRTMKDQIDALRSWAADKRQADDPFDAKPVIKSNTTRQAEVEF